MSVVFRAIPLVMAVICIAFGWYVLSSGDAAGNLVAGRVLISLAAICFALFTTAATIIRQLIHRYPPIWHVVLPAAGYLAAATAVVAGLFIISGPSLPDQVSGHVMIGIGLIAGCVSTVAAASVKFSLIKAAEALPVGGGPPTGAYSRSLGGLLISVPAVLAATGFAVCAGLFRDGGTAGFVAGHVVFGLSVICSALIALVSSVVRQVRNEFSAGERYLWSWFVAAMGTVNLLMGLWVLFSSQDPARLAPGVVLIGLSLICFSILSKVLLLALVWRQTFALANRIPLIPVGTALACLFFAAFLFVATVAQPAFFVGAHVLVGLGAVCFTLFSIVSILEAGTAK
nr:DUF2776 domain-containing protein [Roseomonas sp. SXEYE001]MCV4210441.1 DUF2776 domain-containing protein [Roseomonas sp. SXEYE001]